MAEDKDTVTRDEFDALKGCIREIAAMDVESDERMLEVMRTYSDTQDELLRLLKKANDRYAVAVLQLGVMAILMIAMFVALCWKGVF